MKKILFISVIILLFSACGSEVQLGGCTDPCAINYDPLADYDNGTCALVIGCTDPTALNYDPTACLEEVQGCIYSAKLLWYLSESSYDYMFLNSINEFEIWESTPTEYINYEGSLYYSIGYLPNPPLNCLQQVGVVTKTITWTGNYNNNEFYYMWDIVEPLTPSSGYTHFTDNELLYPNDCLIIPVNGSLLATGIQKKMKQEATK